MHYQDDYVLHGLSANGYEDGETILSGTFDSKRISELESIIETYLKHGRYISKEEGIGYITYTINKLCRHSDFWIYCDFTEYELILALYNKGFKLQRNGSSVVVALNEPSLRKLRSEANRAERDSHK